MRSRPPTREALGAAVCLGALALLACADVTPVDASRARSRVCRPAPGPPPSRCRLLGSDADWLPPAYVRNASCLCQTTPSSPTANCVRGRLDEQIRAVPEATRDAWREKKRTLYDAGRREEYARWVRETAAREIRRWHEQARATCCCSTPLPAYEQWTSVATVPFESCSAARAIARFGGCRGTSGRW